MKYLIAVVVGLILLPFVKRLLGQLSGGGKFSNIGVDEFNSLAKDKKAVILDVRSPGETAQGKIPGAKEINLMGADFRQKIEQLDKNKTYLVYCRSGNRSATACNMMASAGFEHLYNLVGGYGAWARKK
ncbi:MAG: rhodanese-like domain-containing protein [Saprospiraceae bacterium]